MGVVGSNPAAPIQLKSLLYKHFKLLGEALPLRMKARLKIPMLGEQGVISECILNKLAEVNFIDGRQDPF